MNSNKFPIKITVILLIISLLLTFTACSGNGVSVSSSIEKVVPSDVSADVHTQKSENLKSVLKSGLYELLLDETNCSVALKDTSDKIWYTLPEESNTEASLLSLTVSDGKTEYVLNSQDSSVALGTASASVKDSGVTISYVLSEKSDSPKFKIKANLNITLHDGSLTASVNCSKLETGLSDFKITKLSVLPYFGSVSAPASGDFILIPDGCGGYIDLASAEESTYALQTYGVDYAVSKDNSHPAIIPVFGLRSGTSAFSGAVTEGDALSEIISNTSKDGLNRVYASFDITPNSDSVIAENSYGGKVSVTYKFISGSAATYSGLASMCREQLIRDGMLSTRSTKYSDDLPLCITLIGCMNKALGSISEYTSFENAEDIAAVLKSKGINSLTLRYDGALSGGLKQKVLSKAKLASGLGNKKEFESLRDYLSSQGFDFYLTLNLISAASGGKSAGAAYQSAVEISEPNMWKGYIGNSDNFELNGLAASKLISNVVSFMNNMKDYDIQGYCVADAGNYLFSDFSDGFTDRQAYSDSIFSQTIALSTNKNLMVDGGNLYTLKNARIISDIPMSTGYEESGAYSAVPFVQMILHGTVEYTSGYLNLSDDIDTLVLKSIEFGALPSFCWTYSDYIPSEAEMSQLFYDNWTATALEVYTKFNQVMNGLDSAKMTDRTVIQDGLHCTEYNGETYIYVNYTDFDIEYNNMTVKAHSYLRVN